MIPSARRVRRRSFEDSSYKPLEEWQELKKSSSRKNWLKTMINTKFAAALIALAAVPLLALGAKKKGKWVIKSGDIERKEVTSDQRDSAETLWFVDDASKGRYACVLSQQDPHFRDFAAGDHVTVIGYARPADSPMLTRCSVTSWSSTHPLGR